MSKWLENTQKWLDAPSKWERNVENWIVRDEESLIEQQPNFFVKANTILQPQFNEKGKFVWGIKWETNGKDGWIVQKIQNIFKITDCNGNILAIYDDPLLKTYWEAWQVKNGVVLDGDNPGTDLWGQEEIGQLLNVQLSSGYKGVWTAKGTVYFESIIDTKSLWKRNPDLGGLYFTTKDPKIKSPVKLNREASGSVYVCGPSTGWYHKKITIK